MMYQKCLCGAVTLYMDNGSFYCCEAKNLKQYVPGIDLRRIPRLPVSCNCNHCVNHYGLDLCGCGSGEPYGKCDEGLPECSMPMQKWGGRTRVVAHDAIGKGANL